MASVGIIGIGSMGRRAAETIAAAGHAVVVYDVVDAAARQLAGRAGIEVVAALSAVASRADVVLMYLPGPAQVAECVDALDPAADLPTPVGWAGHGCLE